MRQRIIIGKFLSLREKEGKIIEKQVSHPVVNQLDAVVQRVKRNKEWRSEYMRYEHELAAREHLAHEDGRKQGREESILESIRNLMSTMHLTSAEAMNALLIPPEKQKDLLALL